MSAPERGGRDQRTGYVVVELHAANGNVLRRAALGVAPEITIKEAHRAPRHD